MSQRYEKDYNADDWAREKTGIYVLGFPVESVMGFLVPGAIVTFIGGVLAYIIWQML